jgi:hypothetical protein
MSTQLDILALEPFYGGIRRHMLETLIRCSRHRWTLLKLPPRRIERRLTAAAHWFSEQLSRHWVGRVDVLFTSEALNLSDLYRLVPALLKKPSVVYFHSNQLPDTNSRREGPLDLVNLNTAAAATEIWFNSLYHLRTFLSRATAFVERTPELASRNPLPGITAKSQLMLPAVDLRAMNEAASDTRRLKKNKRIAFLDTRDADLRLLNSALATMTRRGEKFELVTVGPVEDLATNLPRRTISEIDDLGQVQAVQEAGLILSAKGGATCDHHLVRGLAAGCWPIVPADGVYPEIVPESIHGNCLYDSVDSLVSRLLDFWHLSRPDGYESELREILHRFDPIQACKAMDERLEELAVIHSLPR